LQSLIVTYGEAGGTICRVNTAARAKGSAQNYGAVPVIDRVAALPTLRYAPHSFLSCDETYADRHVGMN
jgi:hypothetical protein